MAFDILSAFAGERVWPFVTLWMRCPRDQMEESCSSNETSLGYRGTAEPRRFTVLIQTEIFAVSFAVVSSQSPKTEREIFVVMS